jgi:multiple sugar transport system substrate-binding protein
MSARKLPTRLLGFMLILAMAWWMFGDLAGLSFADQQRPLRLSFWGRFEEYHMWQEIIADFTQETGVDVKLEYITTRYPAKLQQLFVADDPPDVMVFEDEPFPRFVASGKLEDLTPYLNTPGWEFHAEDYNPTSVRSFQIVQHVDGQESIRQYGIPLWGGCNLIYYNKEVFDAGRVMIGTNPPGQAIVERDDGWWVVDDDQWTIEQWHRVAQRVTLDRDGDGRIDHFGFAVPNFRGYLPWTWSYGGAVLDEDFTHTVLYGPEIEKALTMFQDLRWGEDPVSPRLEQMTSLTDTVGFFTGRVAMYCSGPWKLPFLSATDLECGVLHIPRGPDGYRGTRITWDCMMMAKQSARKEESWKLIQFAAGPIGQRYVAAAQRSIAARIDMADEFIRSSPNINVEKFIHAARDYARMQPITEHWELMIRVLNATALATQRENPADRLTPAEAIGRFYAGYPANDADSAQLMEVLPPADPEMAAHYREIFLKSGKLP